MSEGGSEAGAWGGVNPDIVQEHAKYAKTLEEFFDHFRGQTLEDLRQSPPLKLEIGPFDFYAERFIPDTKWRYVWDPAFPDKLIDMGHFLSAADQQSSLATVRGFALEIHQSFQPNQVSAFQEEDLRSNALGEKFGREYLQRNEPFVDQLRKFFNDREREYNPKLTPDQSKLVQDIANTMLKQSPLSTQARFADGNIVYDIQRQGNKLTVSISSSARRGIILEAEGSQITVDKVTEVDVENFKKAQLGLQQQGNRRAEVPTQAEASPPLQIDPAADYNNLASTVRVAGVSPAIAVAAHIISKTSNIDQARQTIQQSPEAQRLAANPDAQAQYIDDTIREGLNIALQTPDKIQIQQTKPAPTVVASTQTAPAFVSTYPSPVPAAKFDRVVTVIQADTGFTGTADRVAAYILEQTGDQQKAAAYAVASPEAQAISAGPARDAFVNQALQQANQIVLEANQQQIHA
jgi:septum formation inhibitor MinC